LWTWHSKVRILPAQPIAKVVAQRWRLGTEQEVGIAMPDRAKDELQIFTGNSNMTLARDVCEVLGVRLGAAEVGRFPDGEVLVEIRENVRGGDCFVMQSICTPPND